MEKIAFISGANRGIGFETAKKLAETGVKVILGSRSLEKGEKAVRRLSSEGVDADLVQYDAFDLDAPQKVYDYIIRTNYKYMVELDINIRSNRNRIKRSEQAIFIR